MPDKFEKKVAEYIAANNLLASADNLLLAVSGGADSVALMYAMHSLKKKRKIEACLCIGHINHQLRGEESDEDEDFVINCAAKLGLDITVEQVDVRGFAAKNKLSIETAARRLRIESLARIAKLKNCDCIATAHHKNDNAETILHRILRGTGFRGLAGIGPVRTFKTGAGQLKFISPLLCVTKDEITAYLEKRNIHWRQDESNYDISFTRNFIRHRLLPELQRQSDSSLVEQISTLAESCQRFYAHICTQAETIWENAVCSHQTDRILLNTELFNSATEPVRIELARKALVNIGSGERDLSETHYKKILNLAKNKKGGKIILPDSFSVTSDSGMLVFEKNSLRGKKIVPATVTLQIPGKTVFADFCIEACIFDADLKKLKDFKAKKDNLVEWFDFGKLKLPIRARVRQQGDKFRPIGLAAEKKVGKFITAEKIDQNLRQKIFIVEDAEKIIWICPVRAAEQSKINANTKQILQLRILNP